MKRLKIAAVIAALGVIALIPFSCSKKSDDKDSSSESSKNGNDVADTADSDDAIDNPGEVGTVAISTNGLAVAYPEGLTVTAMPQAVDAAPGGAVGTVQVATLALQNLPPPNQPNNQLGGNPDQFKEQPKDIISNQTKVLNGEGECFAGNELRNLDFQDTYEEICFQFDIGMIAGKEQGRIERGQINNVVESSDKTVTGILTDLKANSQFTAATGQEACMVVKGREKVAQRSSTLNASLALVRGMICQAKKNNADSALPAVGESLDLSGTLTSLNSGGGAAPTVTVAKLVRLADADARNVYQTTLQFSSAQAGNNSTGKYSLILTHSPSAEGNSEYNGVLQFIDGSLEYKNLVSMIYEKSGKEVTDARTRFEIRDASFNVAKIDEAKFWTADGRVEMNAGADANGSFGSGQANDYSKGMGYFAFDINPYTFAGKMSFWVNPGGNYTEGARGFVYSLDQNEDGTLSGCSIVGAVNYSIRQALKEGKPLVPNGCSTPQIQTGGVCTGARTQVWRQCFKQKADGLYEPDTDKIDDDANGYDVLQTAPTDAPSVDLSDIKALAI